MTRTHSLQEAAEHIYGPDSGLRGPERSLRRLINQGRIHALRAGRSYRMTDAQIAEAIEELSRPHHKPRSGQRSSAPHSELRPLALRPTEASLRRRRTA